MPLYQSLLLVLSRKYLLSARNLLDRFSKSNTSLNCLANFADFDALQEYIIDIPVAIIDIPGKYHIKFIYGYHNILVILVEILI